MLKHAEAPVYGADFGIVAAVNQARDARMHQGAGAHRARLARDIQCRTAEAIVADRSCRGANRDDFRVRCRIGVGDGAVGRASNDLAIKQQNRTDRNFSGFCGMVCFSERKTHELFVARVHLQENSMTRPATRMATVT